MAHILDRWSRPYERLLHVLALAACVLLFVMMCMICTDVLLRNVPLIPGLRGLAWSTELSESLLYVITLLAAPWLLRQGQHIRVDILLRGIPPRAAWCCEWAADVLAFMCCVVIAYYGLTSTVTSYQSGYMTIKTLITPEWWMLSGLPAAFVLLSIEFLFRMRRLYGGERAPRHDAVTTG